MVFNGSNLSFHRPLFFFFFFFSSATLTEFPFHRISIFLVRPLPAILSIVSIFLDYFKKCKFLWQPPRPMDERVHVQSHAARLVRPVFGIPAGNLHAFASAAAAQKFSDLVEALERHGQCPVSCLPCHFNYPSFLRRHPLSYVTHPSRLTYTFSTWRKASTNPSQDLRFTSFLKDVQKKTTIRSAVQWLYRTVLEPLVSFFGPIVFTVRVLWLLRTRKWRWFWKWRLVNVVNFIRKKFIVVFHYFMEDKFWILESDHFNNFNNLICF